MLAKVQNNVNNISRYIFRNVQYSQTVHANAQPYFNMLLPSVIRECNALQEATQCLTFLESTTNQLNSDISPPQNLHSQENVSLTNIPYKTANRLQYSMSAYLLKHDETS